MRKGDLKRFDNLRMRERSRGFEDCHINNIYDKSQDPFKSPYKEENNDDYLPNKVVPL